MFKEVVCGSSRFLGQIEGASGFVEREDRSSISTLSKAPVETGVRFSRIPITFNILDPFTLLVRDYNVSILF